MPDESIRKHLDVDGEVYAPARRKLRRHGALADVARMALRAATIAALRGEVERVPLTARTRRPGAPVKPGRVSIAVLPEEWEQAVKALEAAGSSPLTVVTKALESVIACDGDLYAAPMPGEPAWQWRTGSPLGANTEASSAA